MKCADGLNHRWHFFTRLGVALRQCKKCGVGQIRNDRLPVPKWGHAITSVVFNSLIQRV